MKNRVLIILVAMAALVTGASQSKPSGTWPFCPPICPK